jgi:hypothetical protein
LLEAALNGDDVLRTGYLELQVAIVGDGHELGKARSTKEVMVDTGKVDDLKGEWVHVEVVPLTEGDVEPDALEGHGFLAWDNPVQQCLARA